MTTYREAIYMCNDLLKGMSDDFTYTEEHIAYLLDKFRALLLKQRYGNDPKKHVPYSNYQTLEVVFNPTEPKNMLKSNTQIPYMLQLGIPRIILDGEDYYNYRFELTSRERLPFTGNNKFTSMITYCAISETNKLLMKNKESYWVNSTVEPSVISYVGPKKLKLVGIFENPREVTDEESFGESSTDTHEWDRNIPIEESLITTLIELVAKELAGSVYRPNDEVNDNRDDNADMATFIKTNMKSNLAKQLA
jgi:hypothetical protein